MQTVSCEPGQSFFIEGPEGRTRVTVIAVEPEGVRVGVEEAGLHYREVLLTVSNAEDAEAGLLATVG